MSHFFCTRWYKGCCKELCKLCLDRVHFLAAHITKPRVPKMEECCGDSCPNCVWNIDFDEMKEYNKKISDYMQIEYEKSLYNSNYHLTGEENQ